MLETTALGAISLAGLGVGLWPDTAALEQAWQRDRRFSPAGDPSALAALREAWKAAIACA
jgi:glycerol kinase